MKQLLLSICIALLFVSKGKAQVNSEKITTNTITATTPESGNKITDKNAIHNTASVELAPKYSGGLNKWYSFLKTNFRAPDLPGLKGKVIVSFIVERDGSLTDIKILKDVGYGSGREAVRVLKMSPKWTPATQNGEPVRCAYIQTFSIDVPREY